MKTVLWENWQVRILRVDGTISSVSIAFREPEGIDYYWQVGRHNARRGTMYGNPSFFDTRHAFYGAVHYKKVLLKSEEGIVVSLRDLVAIRKFQSFFTQGKKCTIYLLNPKGNSAGDNLVFAIRTTDEQQHDIDNICSMAEHLEAGLSRQLRLIVIPVGISLLIFFMIGLSLPWPFFARQILIITIILLVAFFIAALLVGRAILKKKLRKFPSRKLFIDVLRKNSWQLS